jgi:hypothetical protein
MPPGVGAKLRHIDGTLGPALGPIAPHDTPNSSALQPSLQVKLLAQPPFEEQPGLTVGPPLPVGHCVGSLLRQAMPAPFEAVQFT